MIIALASVAVATATHAVPLLLKPPENIHDFRTWVAPWWLWCIWLLVGVIFVQFLGWRDVWVKRRRLDIESRRSTLHLQHSHTVAINTVQDHLKIRDTQIEQHKREINELTAKVAALSDAHPDVILEILGKLPNGTLRLYNRGEAEAFGLTMTRLEGPNGIIHWNAITRLPAHTCADIKFRIQAIGHTDISSVEQESLFHVGWLLHKNYDEEPTAEQIEEYQHPISQALNIKYLDSRGAHWQTVCGVEYDRQSGGLIIQCLDAMPVPTQVMRPTASERFFR